MNVYDFDNTIYDGESAFDFFLFSLRRHPRLIRYLVTVTVSLVRYKLCRISREELLALAEKNMFGLLHACPDYEALIERFWDRNMKKIKPFYLRRRQEDDVVLTASFDFLIRPCCKRLGITRVICSEADLTHGKITRLCFRENKPTLFDEIFPGAEIENFYTDSPNDLPFIRRARHSFYVRGARVFPAVLGDGIQNT